MAVLNEKNENTEKIIHIMITSLCNRKCPDCCNNQYDLNSIPYVTKEELDRADTLCLTGGEPFAYGNPCSIAQELKLRHPNIKNVYVYSNAIELWQYLRLGNSIYGIDGITVSIKNNMDRCCFENGVASSEEFLKLKSNILYVFPTFENTKCPDSVKKQERHWQKTFVAAPNSIFRKI